jgi:hypothetical protein
MRGKRGLLTDTFCGEREDRDSEFIFGVGLDGGGQGDGEAVVGVLPGVGCGEAG